MEEDEFEAETEHVEPAAHHRLMLDLFERMERGEIKRAMLFLPPGSAKSTYGSIVFPAWFMGKGRNRNVILVSHNGDLAKKHGRRGRQVTRSEEFNKIFDCGLSQESAAADEWSLTNGSEFMSGGILSGITGHRADLLIIDDPIRGRQDADSGTIREKTLDAYKDDLLTRLKPGGRELIIQTRWHEADLAGGLLPENYNGECGMIACRDGRSRYVICLPAECERADDPLGRQIGEMLWPEWFRLEELLAVKNDSQSRTWSALYQQRPAPEEGNYFKADWLKTYTSLPPKGEMRVYGGSDYAVTADGGDYTVHVCVGLDADNRMYVLDLWREQTASDVWIDAFCDMVLAHRPIAWAEETGQIKAALGPYLTRRQRERKAFVAREQFPTRGDKSVRAQSIRGRMAMEGLYLPADAPWLSEFKRELMSFPSGKHDDQCLAEGTLITMADGSHRPIETVVAGDFVATPIGACEVEASCQTNEAAEVYRITFSDGGSLVATGNHPVYIESKGFVCVDKLCMMDQIRLESSCDAERVAARRDEGVSRPRAKQSLVSAATDVLLPSGPNTANTVPRRAVCVTGIEVLSKRVRVRNLTVRYAHTFYANGILTHNCDALGLVGQLLDRMFAGTRPAVEKPFIVNTAIPTLRDVVRATERGRGRIGERI